MTKKKRTSGVQPHKQRLADLAAQAHEGIENSIKGQNPRDATWASSPDSWPNSSSGGGGGWGMGGGGVLSP
jgi:hypothetical protein